MKSSLSQCVEAIEEVGNRLSNWLSFFKSYCFYNLGASSSSRVNILLTHPSYVSSSFRIKQESKEDIKKEFKVEPSEEIKKEPMEDLKDEHKEEQMDETPMEIDSSSLTDTASKKHAGVLLESVIKKLIEDDFINGNDTFSFGETAYSVIYKLLMK